MRIPSFGKDGAVDLKAGAVFGDRPADRSRSTARSACTPRPTIGGGVVMVGSAFREGHTPKTHNNTKGLVQAFDVRTRQAAVERSTPFRGPASSATTRGRTNSWAVNGNVGVWNQMAVDEELGLVYLPVETPTSDFYGGHRPGNNLFADSLVAVDLKTGKRRWHFQLVHHPLWNMDISTAPILEDITVDGKPIKAVSVMGKQAMVYVFDRATGQPVWPIEERPVPQGDVPGEKYVADAAVPDQAAAVRPSGRHARQPDRLHAGSCTPRRVKLMSKYKMGPIFTPPVVSKAEGPLAIVPIVGRHQLAGRRVRSRDADRCTCRRSRRSCRSA